MTAMQQLIYRMDNDILLPSNWREKYLQKEKEQLEQFWINNQFNTESETFEKQYEELAIKQPNI